MRKKWQWQWDWLANSVIGSNDWLLAEVGANEPDEDVAIDIA